jgi:hypothetical protein
LTYKIPSNQYTIVYLEVPYWPCRRGQLVYPQSVCPSICLSLILLPVFWIFLCIGWRCLTEIWYVAVHWIVTDQVCGSFSLTYFWLNYAPKWTAGRGLCTVGNTLRMLVLSIYSQFQTCIVRAWDLNKPLYFAPAMNTYMWEHPITAQQIETLKSYGYKEIHCVEKKLACGDTGKWLIDYPQSK